MSSSAKAFFSLFILLAIGALAHDVYVWQNSNNFPFDFASLGWSAKNYYPDELKLVIDTLGADTFNSIFTPILQIPAFFLTIGIAIIIYALDFAIRMSKKPVLGRGKDRDQQIKFNKRVR